MPGRTPTHRRATNSSGVKRMQGASLGHQGAQERRVVGSPHPGWERQKSSLRRVGRAEAARPQPGGRKEAQDGADSQVPGPARPRPFPLLVSGNMSEHQQDTLQERARHHDPIRVGSPPARGPEDEMTPHGRSLSLAPQGLMQKLCLLLLVLLPPKKCPHIGHLFPG